MIGPKEKGATPVTLSGLPPDTRLLNPRHLPKYICWRAALLKEKLTLKYLIVGLCAAFAVHYVTARLEISGLHQKLREKEYILAPGVLDFVTAAPQSVSDSYVSDAVMAFVSDLGNVNPVNIEEKYRSLARFMSDPLRIRFELDTADWVRQVKDENVAQILTVRKRETVSDGHGSYKVTANVTAEVYANRQHLGREDQVIEMELKLIPPEDGKRWSLQITDLSWSGAETFRAKRSLTHPRDHSKKPQSEISP